MQGHFSVLLRDALVAWVDGCRRWAAPVAVVLLAVAVAAGVYVADTIGIDTDTDSMFSPKLPFMTVTRELDDAFPRFSEGIVVVVDGDTPDLAEDAANRLADRLRARPEVFGTIFHPDADAFFRRNGLLYHDPAELEALGDKLAEAQPFLAVLWRNPSLQGLFEVLDLGLRNQPGATLDRVLAAVAASAEAVRAGRFAPLSWQDLMAGGGERRRVFEANPPLDFATLHPAADAMAGIRAMASELSLDAAHGVRVRLTGPGALAHEELVSVETSLGITNAIALAVVVVLLVVGLKSVRLVIPVLITLIAGLAWTAALGIAMLGEFNVLSVAFALLFIGIGVDFGIHVALRYREGFAHAADSRGALKWAASGVGGPLALCAVAAGIGFMSFLATDYDGLAELGLIAGTGMVVALFANLTLLPALLTLYPLAPGSRGMEDSSNAFVWFEGMHRSRAVVVAALVVAAAAAALVPRARFDFDPLNLKDAGAESVRTLLDLMKEKRTSPYTISVLAKNAEQAAVVAGRLGKLDAVTVTTLGDHVPADQEEKLDTIANMALFLSPLLVAQSQPPPEAARNREALATLLATLDASAKPSARRLHAALSALDTGDDRVLARLDELLLSGLPGRLSALRDSLMARTFTAADLPVDLRERYIAADGRVRVEIQAKDDGRDQASLGRFVDAVRTVAPEAAGNPVVIVDAGKVVKRSLATATSVTLVVLVALLIGLLRDARDVLLAFAPLVLAAVLTVAIMVAIDLPFNFVNIVALPLLFALGLANGIQFVYRERLEADPSALMRSTTPRAVVLSALTTIDSFGSMAVSTHQGTASMGILLGIAITVTLVCTLVVLPAMMRWMPARHHRHAVAKAHVPTHRG